MADRLSYINCLVVVVVDDVVVIFNLENNNII